MEIVLTYQLAELRALKEMSRGYGHSRVVCRTEGEGEAWATPRKWEDSRTC